MAGCGCACAFMDEIKDQDDNLDEMPLEGEGPDFEAIDFDDSFGGDDLPELPALDEFGDGDTSNELDFEMEGDLAADLGSESDTGDEAADFGEEIDLESATEALGTDEPESWAQPAIDTDEGDESEGSSGLEPDAFGSSDEDESVSLSEDELESIIGGSDEGFFEDLSDEQGLDSPGEAIDDTELTDSGSSIPDVDLEPIAPPPDQEVEELGFDDFAGEGDDQDSGAPAEEDGEDSPSGVPADLFGDDDNEPIALSPDELENIMDDVEPDDSESSDDFDDALPDLELEEAPDLEDAESIESDFDGGELPVIDGAPDAEDEEDITLTDEELSQVLLDTEQLEDAGEDIPDAPPLASLDGDDDEPIALTPEELGNIVSEVDEEEVEMVESATPDDLTFVDDFEMDEPSEPSEDEPELLEIDESGFEGAGTDLDLEPDEGPVALSGSEIDSILEDAEEDDSGYQSSPEMPDEPVSIPELEPEEGLINLDEYEEAAPAAAAAEAAPSTATAVAPAHEELADRVADEEGLDKEELRKMIGYLDRLFDQLPDTTIREFSRSEYFDLYKKIMSDLGL